ncbi:MAG: Transcriptional regulator, partial [uncultured Friedmanniella sp.]
HHGQPGDVRRRVAGGHPVPGHGRGRARAAGGGRRAGRAAVGLAGL